MQTMHNNLYAPYARDAALLVTGCIAVLCVAASSPATAAQVARFHDLSHWYGYVAVAAMVLLLEVGTIAAKLAKLVTHSGAYLLEIFTLGGLGINAYSNYAAAVKAASGSLTGASLYVGAVLYGALPCILAYAMLRLFVQRVQVIRGDLHNAEKQVQAALQPVYQIAAMHQELTRIMQTMQPSAPTLPAPMQQYARPRELAQPQYANDAEPAMHGAASMQPDDAPHCIKCGAAVETMKARAASGRWGCSACKPAK